MAKLKHLFAAISFLTLSCATRAQSFAIRYTSVDADSVLLQKTALEKAFPSRLEANAYIVKLPALLQTKGYITASIDSVSFDTASAAVKLYLGEQYKWARINPSSGNEDILEAIHWPANSLSGTIDFTTLHLWQQKILDYLDDNGHPFGKTYLDQIQINGDKVTAILKIDRGPVYKIDSIRVYGEVKMSKEFLQRYLDIPNGTVYSKKKLQNITKKLAELTYIQEEHRSDLSLLGTGAILNLYLKEKKSSQINVLVGFMPNSEELEGSKKLLITADANVLLRNALGSGETMGLVWQQLQQKSPRLNLLFDQPYAFHSPFGLNFSLDMYKKDSMYLNINMNLGTNYHITESRTASVFLQRRQTIVSGVNTAYIVQNHQLPPDVDVSSLNLGAGYNYLNTDYRYNPRKGDELNITATAGTKHIKKNSEILKLEDPNDPSYDFNKLYDTVKLDAYQFRIIASGAHFIPLGGQSTFKLGLNAAIYQSANYFRNELFQIGGNKILRGFDEESQFVSQYAIGTLEYRYRLGLNSFFFAFADGGWGKHIMEEQVNHTYIGTGVGLSFETKAGIINLAWAVGKRDDTDLNLRQSKVHIGFASFF